MNVTELELPGVLWIEQRVFRDDRGFFLEQFHAARYESHGIPSHFPQDNLSSSVRGTLRGLHFQEPNGQGKLVQTIHGTVFDVVVDVRRGSPTFGKWLGVELSGSAPKQLWIPPGYAHGFCVTSDVAYFWYKCSTPYAPDCERTIRWDDPAIGISWPVDKPILSPKDAAAPLLADAPALPRF